MALDACVEQEARIASSKASKSSDASQECDLGASKDLISISSVLTQLLE